MEKIIKRTFFKFFGPTSYKRTVGFNDFMVVL